MIAQRVCAMMQRVVKQQIPWTPATIRPPPPGIVHSGVAAAVQHLATGVHHLFPCRTTDTEIGFRWPQKEADD